MVKTLPLCVNSYPSGLTWCERMIIDKLYFFRNCSVMSDPKKHATFRSVFFRQPLRPCGSGSLQKRSKRTNVTADRAHSLWPWTCRYSFSSSSVNCLPPFFDAGGTSIDTSAATRAEKVEDDFRFLSSHIDFVSTCLTFSNWFYRKCRRAWWSISICPRRRTNTTATSWTSLWTDPTAELGVSTGQNRANVGCRTRRRDSTGYFRFTSFWNP